MGISKLKSTFIIIGVLALLGMLSLYVFWNPTETSIFPSCPVYAATGIYCPGCGSQRAAHKILNGNIIEGVRHNYMIVLLAMVLLYQGFVYVMNDMLGKKIPNLLHKSKVTFSILIIVVLFWVLRNIDLFPFSELAP